MKLILLVLSLAVLSGCGKTVRVTGGPTPNPPTTNIGTDDGTGLPTNFTETTKMVFANSAYAQGVDDQINQQKVQRRMKAAFASQMLTYSFNPAYVSRVSVLVNNRKVCEYILSPLYTYNKGSCVAEMQLEVGDLISVSGNKSLQGEGLPAGHTLSLALNWAGN